MNQHLGQLVIPAGTRAVLDVLAEEFDRLAGVEEDLRRAARTARRGHSADTHRVRRAAYRRCAEMARVVLPGGPR